MFSRYWVGEGEGGGKMGEAVGIYGTFDTENKFLCLSYLN